MNEWTSLTDVDVAEMRAHHFGQVEAAYISGISPQRLVSWHDDELVPEPRDLTGRGHRRRYNITQLAYLIALRAVSDRGVPLKEAAKLAEGLVGRQIADAFDEMCRVTAAEAERVYPMMVVIYDGGEGYLMEVFFQGSQILDGEDRDGPDLYSWFRASGVTNAILLVPAQFAIDLRWKIEEVVADRGTESFRVKLREYGSRFARRPARVPRKRAGRKTAGRKKS